MSCEAGFIDSRCNEQETANSPARTLRAFKEASAREAAEC